MSLLSILIFISDGSGNKKIKELSDTEADINERIKKEPKEELPMRHSVLFSNETMEYESSSEMDEDTDSSAVVNKNVSNPVPVEEGMSASTLTRTTNKSSLTTVSSLSDSENKKIDTNDRGISNRDHSSS